MLNIGLSTTPINVARRLKRPLDGIGVYTLQLLTLIPQLGGKLKPFSFPSLFPNHRFNRNETIGELLPTSYPVQLLKAKFLKSKCLVSAHSKIDVFHATDHAIVRMDCPVVATLHDVIPLKFPHWSERKLRKLKAWTLRESAKLADYIITVSQCAKQDIIEYLGIDGEKIIAVPCGVDSSWLEKPPVDSVTHTLQKYRLRSGYFLFVGTLQPRKNVMRLINAYLALPARIRTDRPLVIIGRAGWNCESEINRLTELQKSDHAVIWLHNLTDNAELRHLYAAAGVFVFPSLYEGYGIPLLEAFASGVPTITSNISSLPEVSAGAALEIHPESESEMKEAMVALSDDTALRENLIQKGHHRAAQFTWENTARLTMEVYKKCLG